MKILHVNISAVSGSTGKIVNDISTALFKSGDEVIVCYGTDDMIDQPGFYKFCSTLERALNALCSRFTGVIYGDYLSLSTWKLIRKIRSESPDIVHLHCLNGFIVDIYRLLAFLAKSRIKVVLTLHAEFMYTGNCSHSFECEKWMAGGCHHCHRFKQITKSLFDRTSYSWKRMRDSISMFDSDNLAIVSVSPWLNMRAQKARHLRKFINEVIPNGVDINVFRFKKIIRQNYTDILSGNRSICLHVTASFSHDETDNKGGNHLINLAERNPEILFLVAANYSERLPKLPSNIHFMGRVVSQDVLADLYNLSDLTIVTSRRETFSMVVAESLCCGTPVLGFNAGGPESIAIKDYCSFVEYGDIDGLELQMHRMLDNHWDSSTISIHAQKVYSSERMADVYRELYNRMKE